MEGQKPIEKFRAGQVDCALWENEITVNGERRAILKATLSKRYKDRDGDWQTSQSYSRTEIPLAIWCLWRAFETMIDSRRGEIEEAVGAASGNAGAGPVSANRRL